MNERKSSISNEPARLPLLRSGVKRKPRSYGDATLESNIDLYVVDLSRDIRTIEQVSRCSLARSLRSRVRRSHRACHALSSRCSDAIAEMRRGGDVATKRTKTARHGPADDPRIFNATLVCQRLSCAIRGRPVGAKPSRCNKRRIDLPL